MKTILPESRKELIILLESGQNLGYQRSKNEVKANLLQKLPNDYISWKPVGRNKQVVPYISWTDCLLILDYVCPNYDYQITENQLGNQVVVKGTITVHCIDGDIKVEALGTEDLSDTAFGGAVMDASAQAMRRACATLGLGRYLYTEPEYHQRQKQSQSNNSSQLNSSKQNTSITSSTTQEQEKIDLIKENSNLLKSLYGINWEKEGKQIIFAKFRKKTRHELSLDQMKYFNKLLAELISSNSPSKINFTHPNQIALNSSFS